MSDIDRPGADDPSPGSASAPWERAWAASRPDDDSHVEPPRRRGRDRTSEDTLSVADLLRRSTGGGASEPDRGNTADDAEDAAHAGDTEDTTVIPVVPAAPAGPPPTPPVAVPARDREAPDRALPAAVGAPTRLQEKKTRRHHRAAATGKVAVALVAAAVLGVTGTAWGGLRYVDSNVRTVQALDPGSSSIKEPAAQLGDENFLLIGSDTREGSSGDVGAGTVDQVQGARSDTTMLAHIPADRSRIVIVSFPRDLEVDLPACEGWDSATGSYTGVTTPPLTGVKLNEAYFEGGPKCITKVVQQLSGLQVNHFLGVDFSGFEAMVDAVDGVQVCTEAPLRDTVLGVVLPNAGTQTLTGAQALNYVRARHVIGDPTSDYGRIQRQQRFLSSLLRASLSSNTLLNLGRLKNLVDAVTSSTFGENVGGEELLTLAQQLGSLQAGRVTFITAPTTGTANARGNEVLRDDANAALFQAIRDGSALPGEETAPATTTTPPSTPSAPAVLALAPSAITLQVLNATGTTGLARSVAAELGGLGWTVAGTGDEPTATSGTVVRYSAGHEADAATVASSVPGSTTVLTTGLGSTVELVLGTDVRGTLVAPTAPGAALPGSAAAGPTTDALPDDLAVVNGGDTTCG